MAARDTSRNRKRRRSAEDIVRIVSESGAGRDNWTVGQNWCRGEGVYSCQLRGGRRNQESELYHRGHRGAAEMTEKKVEKETQDPPSKNEDGAPAKSKGFTHRGHRGVRR